MKTISIKVPDWVKEDEFIRDVKKLLEDKYGVVSVEVVRRRFGVTPSLDCIEVDEGKILALREAEKERLPEI